MTVTFLTNEDEKRILEEAKKTSTKVYEHIATVSVVPDADGNLPKHVVIAADKNGNAFELTEFFIKAHAGFVDGNKSTLYMDINNNRVIANGAISSISSSCRYFNIFFRQEEGGFRRVEYTTSATTDVVFNPQTVIDNYRLIPPMSTVDTGSVKRIDLYTELGDTKAWVNGSSFELWGVRA